MTNIIIYYCWKQLIIDAIIGYDYTEHEVREHYLSDGCVSTCTHYFNVSRTSEITVCDLKMLLIHMLSQTSIFLLICCIREMDGLN
jgi:hypothetical protein